MYDRFHMLLNRHKKYETSDLYANTYGESQTAEDSYVTSQTAQGEAENEYSLLQRIEQYVPEEVEEPATYQQSVITYGADQEEEYTPEEVATPLIYETPEVDTYTTPEPAVETYEEPAVDEPVYIEPVVDEPVYEEPIVDEPV